MDRKCCSSEKPCNFINVRENKDKLYTKYVTYSKSLFVFDIMTNCRFFFILDICNIYKKCISHNKITYLLNNTPFCLFKRKRVQFMAENMSKKISYFWVFFIFTHIVILNIYKISRLYNVICIVYPFLISKSKVLLRIYTTFSTT